MQHNDIELAAAVHYSFLPARHACGPLDIDVKIRPYDVIGGDYCSIYPIDDHRLVLTMCDAVGHGVASALFASRINTFVLSNAHKIVNPCCLVESLNQFLCRHLSVTGMYATFYTIFIDLSRMAFKFAGAAHPPALHYINHRDEVALLDSQASLLGFDAALPVKSAAKARGLGRGDKLVIYTDGLIEARNQQGREFGLQALQEFVLRHHALDSEAFNIRLINELEVFSENRFRDDVLLMTLTVKS